MIRSLLVPFLFVISIAYGENIALKDYTQELYLYNAKMKSWEPCLKNELNNETIIGFYIEPEDQSNNLKLCLSKEDYVFMEGKLLSSNFNCRLFAVDSLMQESGNKRPFLIIYMPLGGQGIVSVDLIRNHVSTGISSFSDRLRINSLSDFMISALVLLLAIWALIYNLYPKHFLEFYNLKRLSSLKIREQNILTAKPLNLINLIFLFAHGLLVSYVIVGLTNAGSATQRPSLYFIQEWLQTGVIVFSLLLLKYLIVYMMGNLFKMKAFVSMHFYDYVSMSKYFFFCAALCLVFFSLDTGTSNEVLKRFVVISFFGFSFARILYLMAKALGATSYRFIHLFSYLCTTEILPLVILAKWAL